MLGATAEPDFATTARIVLIVPLAVRVFRDTGAKWVRGAEEESIGSRNHGADSIVVGVVEAASADGDPMSAITASPEVEAALLSNDIVGAD